MRAKVEERNKDINPSDSEDSASDLESSDDENNWDDDEK